MENREKISSENAPQDSRWDTLYRDQAIENNMTAAMRFEEEKKLAQKESVDPEELEWYKNHPDKLGDLIEGDDPEKEQWYREHPEKIEQLIMEKDKRKKEQSVEPAAKNIAEEVKEEIKADEPETTGGDVKPVVSPIEKEKKTFTEEDKDRLEDKLERAAREGRMSVEHAQSLATNQLGRFSEKIDNYRQELQDKNAVGTPEEEKAYQEWLEKHDEENMENLERTGRNVESIDEDKGKGETEPAIDLIRIIGNARSNGEITDEKAEELEKWVIEKSGISGKTETEEEDDDEIGTIEKIEAEEKERIEAEEKEKIEAEEKERIEAEEREKIEAEEREKIEEAEEELTGIKGFLNKLRKMSPKWLLRAKRNRAIKELEETNREIAKLESLGIKRSETETEPDYVVEARRKAAEIDAEIKKILESGVESDESTESAESAKSTESAGSTETAVDDFTKAKEIYSKIQNIDNERREMHNQIEELKKSDNPEDYARLKELREKSEEKRLEVVELGNKLSTYVHNVDDYEKLRNSAM